ncbi:myeloid cell surface antigen CD33-like [Mauremys reevesii]|uniref:myeloid cell surface antigen CD33-like n=1 Tax=Mauremys reevesii TaxID=260615 RepID=UPI00193EF069|nr:myeloid cell surface antigen CD33-like [Mauremys reevesii]XP_039368621.1 myeloid cell surface antigen CD33-like [Mauremys reevesii]
MGRAPMPQHDARERELPPQGPLWRAGGPATLRVLILALLWRGSLSLESDYSLMVPQSVSVQEGLCVLVPCTFAYPASYDTNNPSTEINGHWYNETAKVGEDSPVASSLSSVNASKETQGRFQLMGNPVRGDCSLLISDARRTDAGRYVFSIDTATFDHTYRSNSDGTNPVLTISVTGLTEKPEIQISPARGLPGTLLAREQVTVTCTAPGRCSGPPPRVTWTGPFSDTARDVSAQLGNGTWAHSSALSFTPGPGDHGKELVCSVTYRPPRGPSTHRTVQLHIGYPPGPPNITGTLTSNRRPDSTGPPNIAGTSNRSPGLEIGIACGLVVLIGVFLLWLYMIKLRGREPAPPSAEAGETANGSQVEHTANEASVIYSTVTRIPMHHKTPAARRTKGIHDNAAAAQGPLGPGKPEELHYASVEFSKLQRKGGEPSEAPDTEYSEVRRK